MILNGNGKLAKREITALEDSWLSFEGALTGYLLQNADEVLQTRGNGQGLKVFDKLYDDPHVQAVLNKLADSVISKDWIVTPGGEKRIDAKAADLVRDQLDNLNAFDLSEKEENYTSTNGFDSLTRSMIISGRLNGYCVSEVMWTIRGDRTVVSEIRIRDPRQFGFMRGEYGYKLRHLTKENSWTGVDVPAKKMLVFSYGALDGNPYGRALGRVIFWSVLFKKTITKFDLKFLENFASPKVVGKYARGSTTEQINTLNAAINAIANETGISLPENVLLEYLQASTSGTVDAYERAMRYWDEQISEAVLTETGSTNQGSGGGSRARDEVGERSAIQTSKAISDALSSTLNRLARWVTEFNLPEAAPPRIYRDFQDKEDLDTRVNRDKVLFDLGYRITSKSVASVYGESYEQAGGDDKEPALISSLGVGGVQALTGLLTQAATGQLPKENAIAVLVSVFGIEADAAAKMVPDAPEQAPQTNPLDQLFGGQGDGNRSGNTGNGIGGADGGNNPLGAGAAFSEDTEDSTLFAESNKDAAELIADKARPLVQEAIAPWLTTITNFVEQATSLEEIRDGLVDLFPELDDVAFAEAMQYGMLLADLAGREEVLQDDADVAFAEAIEAAIAGTLDFAAKSSGGKKPNCNPAKSHFCQTPNGRGSCVPLSKKCKFKPSGAVKAAADWESEKVSGGKAKTNKPKAVADTSSLKRPKKGQEFTRRNREVFVRENGRKIEFYTPDSHSQYNNLFDDWLGNTEASGSTYGFAARYIAGAHAIDPNLALSLPSHGDVGNPMKQAEAKKVFASLIRQSGTDGEPVVMQIKGKEDREIALALGLSPAKYYGQYESSDTSVDLKKLDTPGIYTNIKGYGPDAKESEIWIGKKQGNQVVPFADAELEARRYISLERGKQIDALQEHNQWVHNFDDPPPKAEQSAFNRKETTRLAKVEKAEDKLLGRKPGNVGDYKSYQQKSEKWATKTFGTVDAGANGFTLAQTKAHDVAHPVTHELLNSDSAGIHKRLGSLKQADGKPSLLGEEAIVNVVEHLSRGDTIEGSVLNGLRLARVLSRTGTDKEKAYVRSRKFKNELIKMGHELYRNNNFSPLIKHVRQSNRESGTVLTGGGDFTNSASGG